MRGIALIPLLFAALLLSGIVALVSKRAGVLLEGFSFAIHADRAEARALERLAPSIADLSAAPGERCITASDRSGALAIGRRLCAINPPAERPWFDMQNLFRHAERCAPGRWPFTRRLTAAVSSDTCVERFVSAPGEFTRLGNLVVERLELINEEENTPVPGIVAASGAFSAQVLAAQQPLLIFAGGEIVVDQIEVYGAQQVLLAVVSATGSVRINRIVGSGAIYALGSEIVLPEGVPRLDFERAPLPARWYGAPVSLNSSASEP